MYVVASFSTKANCRSNIYFYLICDLNHGLIYGMLVQYQYVHLFTVTNNI